MVVDHVEKNFGGLFIKFIPYHLYFKVSRKLYFSFVNKFIDAEGLIIHDCVINRMSHNYSPVLFSQKLILSRSKFKKVRVGIVIDIL